MTVTAQNRKNQFSTNGVTTEFTFTFKITNTSQVYAYTVIDGVETEYTDFTVAFDDDEGGTVTTGTALSGVDLLIYRDTPLTQQVDYESGGKFPADSHEQALDKLTLQNQDQQEELDRTLKSSISNSTPYTIGQLEDGKLIGLDGTEIKSLSSNLGEFNTLAFEADNVLNMLSGIATNGSEVTFVTGQVWSTGGTKWRVINSSGTITLDNFEAIGSIFANDFGIITSTSSDTAVDNHVALQQAIDKGAASTVYYSGFIGVGDTIYIPRGTNFIQLGNIDGWSGRTTGGGIVGVGTGTKRIWTDKGEESREYDSTWFELRDSPISVTIITEGDTLLENVYCTTNDDTPWDVGIFNPGCKRVVHKNVDTYGGFNLTGYYIDKTWSDFNDELNDIHANTYGRAIQSDAGPNECNHYDCYYRGGAFGLYGKGTERNPDKLDSYSAYKFPFGYGGVSDLNFYGCRFGVDNQTGDLVNACTLYFDWGWTGVDVNANDKFAQNRYFYGCSFRAAGARYAVCLDRSRYDQFIGLYGENSTTYIPSTATSTIQSVELIVAPNPVISSNNLVYKVGVSGSKWNILTTIWTLGAYLTMSNGATARLDAIGYDESTSTRYMYLKPNNIAGTLTVGDTITQEQIAAGKVFVAMDRTQFLKGTGQSQFSTASASYASDNCFELNYPRANLSGSRFNELASDVLSVAASLSSTGSQVNLYTNALTTKERLRWIGSSLDSYNQANLGSSSRMWNTVYAVNGAISTSDERLKDFEGITETEKLIAIEVKESIKKFKWKSDGTGGKVHFGVGAQTVMSIFEKHGLNALDYSIVEYAEWDDEIENDEVVQEAGNRYGVMYSELAMFILSAM